MGFWTFITGLVQRHYQKKDRSDAQSIAMKNAVIAMLHDRLYVYCNEYIARGSISTSEMKNLEYIYKCYAELGGNGTGKELYDRCKKLDIK